MTMQEIAAAMTCRRRARAFLALLATLVPAIATSVTSAGVVVAQDFEADQKVTAIVANGAKASATIDLHGTIDSFQGTPGKSASLDATFAGTKPGQTAGLTVRTSASPNVERDPAKLTIAADVWIEHVRPIKLRVASIDSSGRPSGVLTATILPPVGGAWYRHEFDLSALKTEVGTFDPAATQIEVTFELAASEFDAKRETMHVDNISLSAPSYYVSEKGSDSADGRSEATAFATVQRGIDAAAAGDVVLILNGTYHNTGIAGLARIAKAGSPARWITIRSAPGHSPKLTNDGWEVVKIVPKSAYIELRGLDISGNRAAIKVDDALADGVIKEKDGKKYAGDPAINGNGLSAEGREATTSADRPHHLRFIGNHVHDNCGGGISAIACDYVTIEGNDVHDNAHYMRYGGSGVSCLNLSNFDNSTGHRVFIFNNITRNNRCYVPWAAVGKMSDGNNIIIDVNIRPKTFDGEYIGRSLIANNLIISGGGGGVTVTTSRHVDIVNNTLYHNVQTDFLAQHKWADILISGPPPNCEDVRVYNNIVWAAPGRGILHAGRANDYTIKITFSSATRRRTSPKATRATPTTEWSIRA